MFAALVTLCGCDEHPQPNSKSRMSQSVIDDELNRVRQQAPTWDRVEFTITYKPDGKLRRVGPIVTTDEILLTHLKVAFDDVAADENPMPHAIPLSGSDLVLHVVSTTEMTSYQIRIPSDESMFIHNDEGIRVSFKGVDPGVRSRIVELADKEPFLPWTDVD